MGCSNSLTEVAQKQALEPQCNINIFGAQYAAPGSSDCEKGEAPFVLHFKAKMSWSNADTTISNPITKQTWFKIDGKALSLSSKKTLFDANGQPVFLIKEKVLQLDDKQTVCSPDGETELFCISSNFGNTKQHAKVQDQSGVMHEIYMAMDFMGFKGGMWIGNPEEGGKLVAKVRSPLEFQNFIPDGWDREDFFVEFSPGLDTAFMAAMIAAYTEMENTYDE